MTIWLPGLLVLVAGALAGWWWVRRSGKAADPKSAKLAEQKLRLQDLTQRKQDLLARLQSGVEDLDSAERQRLEIEAARVLREMDQLGARGAQSGQAATAVAVSSAPAAPAAGGNWLRRNPLLTGFLFGGGMVGLAALLIFQAARDPGREGGGGPMMGGAPPPTPGAPTTLAQGAQGGQGGQGSTGGAEEPPPGHPATGQAPTTPEIDRLTKEVEGSPTDLNLRRQLAIAYLTNNQLIEAFQQARFVLQAAPKDPDGLMVVGVVRMAMGNLDEAGASLDAALAERPNDPVAHLYRGLVWAQSGDTTKAIEVWERGRQAAGGSFPQIEQLIAEARQAAAASGNAGSIPSNAATSAPPTAPPPTTEQQPMQIQQPAVSSPMGGTQGVAGTGGPTFPVRIEMAPGVTSPEGAVLFVSLRLGPGGPPVAVRRIEGASFPLDLEISGADVMMGGGQLPSEGHFTARLDRDGNATTREADEPMAALAVVAGKPVTLVLAVQR